MRVRESRKLLSVGNRRRSSGKPPKVPKKNKERKKEKARETEKSMVGRGWDDLNVHLLF